MMHRAGGRRVVLHEGECGTWDLQCRVARRGAQEGAGECRLAGAELALEQDRIAGVDEGGDLGCQGLGCVEVGQLDEACRDGGGHGRNVAQRRSRGQQRARVRRG